MKNYLGHGRWGLKATPSTGPKPTRRAMPAIKYKPKYDEPPAKKKPARKRKVTRKSRARKPTTATRRSTTRPTKRLPKMQKSWWPFW